MHEFYPSLYFTSLCLVLCPSIPMKRPIKLETIEVEVGQEVEVDQPLLVAEKEKTALSIINQLMSLHTPLHSVFLPMQPSQALAY